MAAAALLIVAVGGYVVLHARSDRAAEQDTVRAYVRAWSARDWPAMYATLDEDVRQRTSEARFARMQSAALSTATAQRVRVGALDRGDGAFDVRVAVATRAFGTFRGTVRLPLDGTGSNARVAWSRSLAFPGLRTGEVLRRSTQMPPRASILARDGTVLAQGAARSSPDVPNIAGQVVGSIGPALPADRARLARLGVPAGESVGVSGLERLLNPELVGTPGGTLRAGDRVLRRVSARQAPAVRSSISVPVVKALVSAQASAPAEHGAVVVSSRTGEVLGFEGQAFTLRQPPGSTMKIVTASAALADGLAKTTSTYPRQTASAQPIVVQNSDEESCGGTLVESFADSCNSVFVPLGGRLGPQRLVAMARRFGFDRPVPGLPGAALSQIPDPGAGTAATAAQEAIGQGAVLATPVQVALMGATIANHGEQPRLTFQRTTKSAPTRRVVSTAVADDMEKLMLAVVRSGTGKAAAVPGVLTAGKTGTAEIRATQGATCEQAAAPDSAPGADPQPKPDGCGNADGKSTDAWMSAYAPASGPNDPIAVGVLRVANFQGGEKAAPVARVALTVATKP